MKPRNRYAPVTPDDDRNTPRFLQRARRLQSIASARMPSWQLRLIYVATTLLVGSGALWLLLHHFAQRDSEFGSTPHPAEHSVLALHGAAAMVFLFVLGSLLPVHVLRGLALQRNLASGWMLAAINAVLIATGYGLYYASGETLRSFIGLSHWIPGLAVGGVLALHIVLGRRHRS